MSEENLIHLVLIASTFGIIASMIIISTLLRGSEINNFEKRKKDGAKLLEDFNNNKIILFKDRMISINDGWKYSEIDK